MTWWSWKTQHKNFVKHTRVSVAKSSSGRKDIRDWRSTQWNKVRTIREKRVKTNEQSLQEIGDYVKISNLCLIIVSETDGKNETKLENTLWGIIQENFSNLARQANLQIQKIQRTPGRYSSRRATRRHIFIRFTKVEKRKKMLRTPREKDGLPTKGSPSDWQWISWQKP